MKDQNEQTLWADEQVVTKTLDITCAMMEHIMKRDLGACKYPFKVKIV